MRPRNDPLVCPLSTATLPKPPTLEDLAYVLQSFPPRSPCCCKRCRKVVVRRTCRHSAWLARASILHSCRWGRARWRMPHMHLRLSRCSTRGSFRFSRPLSPARNRSSLRTPSRRSPTVRVTYKCPRISCPIRPCSMFVNALGQIRQLVTPGVSTAGDKRRYLVVVPKYRVSAGGIGAGAVAVIGSAATRCHSRRQKVRAARLSDPGSHKNGPIAAAN